MAMRIILAVVALMALTACARPQSPRAAVPSADLGEVAATERAFASAAREEGTWSAFRRYAAPDALWPTPAFTLAPADLAGLPDPPEPIIRGPQQVWASCDGSFAVSTGGARFPDGHRTRFVTVWQRQEDGAYRWVLDQNLPDDGAKPDARSVPTNIADCLPVKPGGSGPVRREEDWTSGRSDDATLAWQTTLADDCAREVVVRLRRGNKMREVLRRQAPPPPAPAGQPPARCG